MLLFYVLIVILAVVVLALAWLIFNLKKKLSESSEQKNELGQRIEFLDKKIAESNSQVVSSLSSQIRLLSENLGGSLQTVQKSVDQRLGENTNRLDNASKSYAEVKEQLAKLQEQTKKVFEVGKDMSSLHEILRAPKVRGVMGEFLLENLLSQMLSHDHYSCPYTFRSGEKVDAAVKLKNYLIPVDSKFPLENFKKVSEAHSEAERIGFKKQFGLDVKKHINSIAEKYILPDEGTVDFALMYVPAENVYYEIISHKFGNVSLFDYAMGKRVIPVSPNTFYAYLGTIVMGLKGMKIEKNAKVILQNLKRLEIEFGKIRDDFVVLGTHLKNAQGRYELTDKRMNKFENQLEKSRDKELEEPKAAVQIGQAPGKQS